MPEREVTTDEYPAEWVEEVERRGVHVIGERLRPVADATTVRVRAGQVSVADGAFLVSDGPYAETREQIGGFDVIDCADLDEAIEIASKHPAAAEGFIELRPFWPFF